MLRKGCRETTAEKRTKTHCLAVAVAAGPDRISIIIRSA